MNIKFNCGMDFSLHGIFKMSGMSNINICFRRGFGVSFSSYSSLFLME